MKPIRMVVIDDSKAVRKIISAAVETDPDIQIVGQAGNGQEGHELVRQVRPDVVLVDVEMPVMDGLDCVSHIRQFDRAVPIIMFSAFTKAGSRAVMDALARGATDYQLKPTGVDGYTDAIARLRTELVPKIRALGRAYSSAPAAAAPFTPAAPAMEAPAAPRRPARPQARTTLEAVVLASSTGGPSALEVVLSGIDRSFELPILIVQHIPPMFSAILAEWLNSSCPLTVVEAENGMKVKPRTVYIAPGGLHMRVQRADREITITTDDAAPVNSCRPAADLLFRSAAPVWHDAVLGVVLTGMGQDGLNGAQDLVNEGADVIVQDEATSVVWGMPGLVHRAGLATETLPLPEIAGALARLAGPVRSEASNR
ncbi:MAG: chemotaxis-specific protein-glutamate methyltransferase CheB [Acidimicrobiia bacterium]|nr:chemotaxis-specific protein-glutamate methyltransferase CheB [Acidimicrobiia bacterium]